MNRLTTSGLCVVALAACGKHGGGTQGPQVTVVTGAPQALATSPTRDAATGVASPTVVSTLQGAVVAGTSSGVFIGSKSGDALTAMAVVATGSDPLTTGAVTDLARRSSGGALVHAQSGLFQDQDGYLLFSPLSASLMSLSPTTMDALGKEPAEELWFSASPGALYVGGGAVQTYDVTGASGAPDAVVPAGAGQAVIAWDGSAYLLDLNSNTLTDVGDGVGKVNGFDHGDDGTVYLATSGGLYARTRAGVSSLYTLAGPGQPAANVLAVGSAFGSVYLATATQLLSLDGTVAHVQGPLTQGQAGRSVTVDSNGDAWVIDQGQLAHFRTGKPVSYAADVKPFFDKHCTVCHWTSASGTTANGAPPTNFDDYATAVSIAPLAINRMEANGYLPMPPPTANDPLTPTDYAVVIRWVGGGNQP